MTNVRINIKPTLAIYHETISTDKLVHIAHRIAVPPTPTKSTANESQIFPLPINFRSVVKHARPETYQADIDPCNENKWRLRDLHHPPEAQR